MACGDCPCNGSGINPDFPNATPSPDYPALNLDVNAEGDQTDVASGAGGFSFSSVEWWQWVLVLIALILLVKDK